MRIPYVTQRNKYKGFPMIDQSVNVTAAQSLWEAARGRDFARGITGGWAEPTPWNLRNIEEIGEQTSYDSLALVLFKSLPGDAKKFL